MRHVPTQRASTSDRGQALSLVVVTIVFVALATIAIGTVVAHLADRSRAQSSADAAALAGVTTGADGAALVASLNGAHLVSFRRDGGDAGDDGVQVTVRVVVGGESATAAASTKP